MAVDHYTLARLVADLLRICSEASDDREVVSAVRPLARRAALAGEHWLEDRFFNVDSRQGFGAHLLHAEPAHGLIVAAQSWLPGRGAPPHDHGTWAVIAGVDGPEKNEFFERVDDGTRTGYAELRKIGEKVLAAGDVLGMPTGAIHSVRNESNAITLSLHIYGRDPNFSGRSQFDLEARTERPFFVRVEPRRRGLHRKTKTCVIVRK